MQYLVDINRSQFDARAVIVLPDEFDQWIGEHVHVFTDTELHDLAERIADLVAGRVASVVCNETIVYDILTSEREPDSADGGSGERTP